MGWTSCFTAKYYKPRLRNGRLEVDRKKCVDDIYTCEYHNADGSVSKLEVIRSAMVGSTWYGAVRITRPNAAPIVTAGICLTGGRGKDGSIWGYKDFDETMGPYSYNCPKSILDLLTPTDSEYAIKWRRQCRRNLREKENPIEPPAGVTATYRGGWVISSHDFRQKYYSAGVRYRHRSRTEAIDSFVSTYGTEDQLTQWRATKENRNVIIN